MSFKDWLRSFLGIDLIEEAIEIMGSELAGHTHEGGGGEPGEPHEHEYVDRVVPMFNADGAEDVKVFVKDENITQQLDKVGGLLRGTNLTLWFDDGKGILNGKTPLYPILIIPQAVQSLIKMGGVGPLSRGSATVQNNDGKDNAIATCTWVRTEDARFAVQVMISPDASPRISRLKPDYPWNSQYGTHVRLTIALP